MLLCLWKALSGINISCLCDLDFFFLHIFFILQMIKLPLFGVENQSKHNVSLCGGGEAKVVYSVVYGR